MTREEANKNVSNLLEQARGLIREAEKLCDKYGLEMSSPVGAYGMGGTYVGRGEGDNRRIFNAAVETVGELKKIMPNASEDDIETYIKQHGDWEESNSGWISSSSRC